LLQIVLLLVAKTSLHRMPRLVFKNICIDACTDGPIVENEGSKLILAGTWLDTGHASNELTVVSNNLRFLELARVIMSKILKRLAHFARGYLGRNVCIESCANSECNYAHNRFCDYEHAFYFGYTPECDPL